MSSPLGRRITPLRRWTETRFRPQLLGIGDSIIAGHPVCFTQLEANPKPGANITMLAAGGRFWTWANQGIGSNTTSQMVARFTADVVNLQPKAVIINGGVNDIAGGGSQATFINNYTTMLNACQTSGFKTVVVNILPWTGGTNTQLQTRDTWNAALVALVATYAGFISLDASALVGQFRAGGDVNNLWDIRVDCRDDDQVHFNPTGYQRIGDAVARAL